MEKVDPLPQAEWDALVAEIGVERAIWCEYDRGVRLEEDRGEAGS